MAKSVNEDGSVAAAIERLDEGCKATGRGTKRRRGTKGDVLRRHAD